METIFSPEIVEGITKLGLAMILGMLLGLERSFAHKTAGMRTYALVSLGAALFVVISETIGVLYLGSEGFDPSRIASQIVVGVGFLGAGLLVVRESKLLGLTTASGLWVSAGIGTASGFGMFSLAIVATVLTLFVFTILWFVETRLTGGSSD